MGQCLAGKTWIRNTTWKGDAGDSMNLRLKDLNVSFERELKVEGKLPRTRLLPWVFLPITSISDNHQPGRVWWRAWCFEQGGLLVSQNIHFSLFVGATTVKTTIIVAVGGHRWCCRKKGRPRTCSSCQDSAAEIACRGGVVVRSRWSLIESCSFNSLRHPWWERCWVSKRQQWHTSACCRSDFFAMTLHDWSDLHLKELLAAAKNENANEDLILQASKFQTQLLVDACCCYLLFLAKSQIGMML